MSFKKVITALVTPFQNGEVDFESLEKLVNTQIDAGIEGFVINGTTGESPTLDWSEVEKIFSFVKNKVSQKNQKDFKLILGTGSNSTAVTIEKTKKAKLMGADAVLVVVPYYNKPNQEGLFRHFQAVAEASQVPVILYNVPGRTVAALSLETIERLSKVKNIIGIKEASGNIEFASQIHKTCGDQFVLLSGDDGTYSQFLKAGGHGIISVATHIIPKIFINEKKALSQNFSESSNIRKLIDGIYVEPNPIPVKKALQMMGVLKSAELRLPLIELDEKKSKELKEKMLAVGVL